MQPIPWVKDLVGMHLTLLMAGLEWRDGEFSLVVRGKGR